MYPAERITRKPGSSYTGSRQITKRNAIYAGLEMGGIMSSLIMRWNVILVAQSGKSDEASHFRRCEFDSYRGCEKPANPASIVVKFLSAPWLLAFVWETKVVG